MPHVVVKLAAGRTEDQKSQLAQALSQTIMAVLSCEEIAVSVGIEDIPSGEWFRDVYEPDIRKKIGTIYKKPGYTPT